MQQQTAHWSTAQWRAYEAKLQLVDLQRTRNTALRSHPTSATSSTGMYMLVVGEGSSDCACGPASVTESYTSYNYYYGLPNPAPTLSTIANEMKRNGWLLRLHHLHSMGNNSVGHAPGNACRVADRE